MKTDRFHPADDRLIALYFGDGEALADDGLAVRQHLHGCEACTWRYTELTAPLERLRLDAASEADEVFTPARLGAQRERILARLDEASQGSRVIQFPASSARMDRSLVRRPVVRWVAAAAAAGLLVGVMAGRLLEFGSGRVVPTSPVVATERATTAPVPRFVSDVPAETALSDGDEAILSEIDRAVFRQRIAELSALDELTPRLRQADAVMVSAIR